MWSYHKETRRFSLGGVGLGIFICSTSFSPGDQKNFSWLVVLMTFKNWIPPIPPYQEKISLSPGPLMFYFVFNVVAVLIENLWKVYLNYFWWFDWKSMSTFSKNLLTLLNGVISKRPEDFLLVGWGWEYLFVVLCNWWFDCKSMRSLFIIF